MAFRMTLDGETHEIEVVRLRPRLVLRVDGREHALDGPGPEGDGPGTLRLDGRDIAFDRAGDDDAAMVRIAGRTYEIAHFDPRAEAVGAAAAHDEVRAPMPGLVVELHKAPGDAVTSGEPIVTIESMKLQTALLAPRDGVLAEAPRAEGETFEKDAVLARLEPTEA